MMLLVLSALAQGADPETRWGTRLRASADRIRAWTHAHLSADTGQTALGGYGSVLVGGTWTARVKETGDKRIPRLVLSGGLGVQRLDYDVGPYGVNAVLPAAHSNIGLAL